MIYGRKKVKLGTRTCSGVNRNCFSPHLICLLMVVISLHRQVDAEILKGVARPNCDTLLLSLADSTQRHHWEKTLRTNEIPFWQYIDSIIEYSLNKSTVTIPSYFVGNFPSATVLINTALNERLAQLKFGDFDSPNLRSQLQGIPTGRSAIVVHQKKELHNKTTTWLKKNRFQQSPRLMLFSESFPLRTSVLLDQATLLEYSTTGTYGSVINTSEIHLVGGNLGSCLHRALTASVVNAFNFHRSITVHLYTSLIYGDSKELEKLHSGGSLDKGEWQTLAELAVLGHFQLDRTNWSPPNWVQSDPPTFSFAHRNGKILNIVFHNTMD